ncbi:alpha-glucosidase [Granulicella aggregans]|uniref:Alpha-glucosidase n=1 Tax=Granulicella aggregans TaxID=474949 RepID=A0A7W7ZGT0_9BACT|nr:TIM-barrel domain-containing protein [Granulicella aggregans]MBB5059562.1 alpha-glucosidase [Granulicella aggregans]
MKSAFAILAVVLLPFVSGVPRYAAASNIAESVGISVLPDGVMVSHGGNTLRVTALRDDVLRVTASHARGQFPEKASWAVVPAALSESVKVVAGPNSPNGAVGFRTNSLQVSISVDMRITIRDLAGNILQEDAAPIEWHKHGFTVAKQKHQDDHFFGLGDKPGPLDRAGEAFTMWNTDMFGWQESTDPIYKTIPFFINFRAGHATGLLLDNTFRTNFDFGRSDPNEYTFGAVDGPLTYYFWSGPEPKKVVETYAWLTGTTPLPPMWSLGFQQSRYSYETETRLMTIANRLRADKIPSDALYLDIDFQEKNRPFTVDTKAFPRFKDMVSDLAKDHFHLIVITDLHIAKLPDAGYAPYDSGIAGDHFVKNPDGSVFSGVVWPGPAVFPDFTQKVSRDWWGTLYKGFTDEGVAGFWNDMNEPAVFEVPTKTMPDNVQHRIDEPGFARRTATHLEIHNVFGMENSRGTYEGLLKLQPDVRPFVLTRASYAGGQRYAATWTGDNSATWNHLRQTVPQIENLGLSGFAMTGADVGGFAGSPPPDLLTKWIEIGAFQPIDRDHSAKGTRDHEVWVDGPEHEAIRKHFIEERYRLMPYLYTSAEETSRTGLPIMRPLFLEFPDATTDGHPLDNDATGEFLFGDRILVAASPSPEEVAPYEVQLPPGQWYDYWTGERLAMLTAVGARDLEQRDALPPNKPIYITPKLAELPVYVRGGSIIPVAPLTQSTMEKPDGPLTLRVYPGAKCEGSVYQDDGTSFAYREGKFFRQHFSCTEAKNGAVTVKLEAPTGSFTPWWNSLRIEVYGLAGKQHIAVANGKSVKVEATTAASILIVPAASTATEVTFR